MLGQHVQENSLLIAMLNTICLGLLILASYFFLNPVIAIARLTSVPGAAALALATLAVLARFSFNSTTSPIITRRILVLGVGEDAALVKAALDDDSVCGHSLVGFYAVEIGQRVDAALPANKILPPSKSIEETVRTHRVNEIVLATRERRGGALPLSDLLGCKLRGIKVTDLSAFFEKYQGKVRIDFLHESWFIFGSGFRQHRARLFVKRVFDILASTFVLILSLPVMLLAAIAIKLESAGPVIYRQERIGLGRRSFDLLKFRSMRADAEKDGMPQWARAGDTRVTRVGRLMRLTRIDELPQLLSVLSGQMSLVGPRPERPYFVEKLVQAIPFYDARHSVKPGVTGWAQVRHHYGASVDDARDKLQYDLYYVKNHTLLLDLVVLFHSVRVVLFAQGAR